MKAVLIAGGRGTRLRPLTDTRPKHLLPIANRPHLHHVFDLLSRHGVADIVLLTSYLAETFEASIAEAERRGMNVSVAHEEEPLGTAGALKNAEGLIGAEPFLAFNGDILTDLDLDALIGWHRARGAEATIWLTRVDDPSAFGVVQMDPEGNVEAFVEKPDPGIAPTDLVNAGVYVFEPSILDRIPAATVYSAERELFPGLVEEGTGLFATHVEAYWKDIGTPQKYLEANLDALRGIYPTDAVERPGEDAVVWVEDGGMAEDAEVALACIGAGASVGSRARVERSVLLPGAVVGVGATVEDSVLGTGAVVPAGMRVERATLGDGEEAVPSEEMTG